MSQRSYRQRFQDNFRSPGEVFLCLRMGAWMLALPALLKALSLPRLLAFLEGGRPRTSQSPDQSQLLGRYADFWLRCLGQEKTCLWRSLVVFHYLRHRGCDVVFCLGVHRRVGFNDDQNFRGHAWLLWQDRVLLEPQVDSEASSPAMICTFRYPDGER